MLPLRVVRAAVVGEHPPGAMDRIADGCAAAVVLRADLAGKRPPVAVMAGGAGLLAALVGDTFASLQMGIGDPARERRAVGAAPGRAVLQPVQRREPAPM